MLRRSSRVIWEKNAAPPSPGQRKFRKLSHKRAQRLPSYLHQEMKILHLGVKKRGIDSPYAAKGRWERLIEKGAVRNFA